MRRYRRLFRGRGLRVRGRPGKRDPGGLPHRRRRGGTTLHHHRERQDTHHQVIGILRQVRWLDASVVLTPEYVGKEQEKTRPAVIIMWCRLLLPDGLHFVLRVFISRLFLFALNYGGTLLLTLSLPGAFRLMPELSYGLALRVRWTSSISVGAYWLHPITRCPDI